LGIRIGIFLVNYDHKLLNTIGYILTIILKLIYRCYSFKQFGFLSSLRLFSTYMDRKGSSRIISKKIHACACCTDFKIQIGPDWSKTIV